MTIALGLPRGRDKTFVDTDLYPHNTELRLQLAAISGQSIIGTSEVEIWHSLDHLWPLDVGSPGGDAGTSLPLTTAAAVFETRAPDTFSRGYALSLPLGSKLISARFFVKEAGATAIKIDLYKQTTADIIGQPPPGTNTLLETVSTPGGSSGDVTVTMTPSEPLLIADGSPTYQFFFTMTEAGDELKGLRLRYDPVSGLA